MPFMVVCARMARIGDHDGDAVESAHPVAHHEGTHRVQGAEQPGAHRDGATATSPDAGTTTAAGSIPAPPLPSPALHTSPLELMDTGVDEYLSPGEAFANSHFIFLLQISHKNT